MGAENNATKPAGTGYDEEREETWNAARQHQEKAQESLREAVKSLRKAQKLLEEAEDRYGNEKGKLALYSRSAAFYAGRADEISQRVAEMIEPEAG